MLSRLKPWLERIDALSLKERVLVLCSVTLALVMAWDTWFLKPLEGRRSQLQNSVSGIQQNLRDSETLAQTVIAAGQIDPDAPLQSSLAGKQAVLTQIQHNIKAKVGRMVPPEQMAQMLESVLTRFEHLQFVGLEGLGVAPLTKPHDDTDKSATPDTAKPSPVKPGAYRHGLRIRFAGSYLDAVAYLRALESLPYGFFWDEIKLETTDYPRAEGSIVVYTLSLDPGWIGV